MCLVYMDMAAVFGVWCLVLTLVLLLNVYIREICSRLVITGYIISNPGDSLVSSPCPVFLVYLTPSQLVSLLSEVINDAISVAPETAR